MAQGIVVSGDTVLLQPGDYGAYTEVDENRTNYVTYRSATSQRAHISHIQIRNSAMNSTYLKFISLDIKPDWRNPCDSGNIGCDDPQYPESTQSTYSKTFYPVELLNASYVQILDSEIHGQNRHLTAAGCYLNASAELVISGNDIYDTVHGVRVISGNNVTISGNHIHHISGTSAGMMADNNIGIVVENNYMHDGFYSDTEDYAPRAAGQNIHGSGVSIRDGNTIVRGNIIHDTGTTSGIAMYYDDAGYIYHNDNVLIENNLLYDLGSTAAIKGDKVGTNVIIRNNTVLNRKRLDTSYGAGIYQAALQITTWDDDGVPAVEVYNNIFLGMVSLNHSYITEYNNIIWSYPSFGTFDYLCTGDPLVDASDYIYTCSGDDPSNLLFDLFDKEPQLTFNPNHGLYLDFTFTDSSMAYNFGDAATQPTESLGTCLDRQWVLPNGEVRTPGKHSVGAYEFTLSTPNGLPLNLFVDFSNGL